jgi:hypothetical protein
MLFSGLDRRIAFSTGKKEQKRQKEKEKQKLARK